MSSSKPTTPLTSRHQFSYEPTRIPQPSPQPLRRSLSLRLRSDTSNCSKYVSASNGGGDVGVNSIDHTSPMKPSFNTSTTSVQPGNKYFRREKLPNSKSLSFIGGSSRSSGMAHFNGSSSKETSPISNGGGPSSHCHNKCSPTSAVPINCKQNNSSTHEHHGMVSIYRIVL